MSFGRHTTAFALVALTAACATPSIRTVGDAAALSIASVSVDTSDMPTAVEGRASAVTRDQLSADLTASVTASLAARSDPAGVPVDVAIKMSKLRLAPPLQRVVAGTSTAVGTVTVTEVGTGKVIVPPTEVSGNTTNFRGVSVLGVATTVTVEKDYRGTLAGFSNTVREALFGPDQ